MRLNESEEGLIHEFFVNDPTGDNDFHVNLQAEKDADKWLKEHSAVLHALVRDREESLPNGVMRVHYKLYGWYIQ